MVIGESTVSKLSRLMLSSLLFASVFALTVPLVSASAQPQVVAAAPGNINLGLTTSITVTAPTAGSYTVLVDRPSGASTSLPFVATAAGQTQTSVFGNATSGFDAIVNQVGTYTVSLEQGTTVVGTSSFYATNKLFITMDMVTGGTCYFINSDARGYKFIPRFYVYYASNPTVPLTSVAVNATAPGASPTLLHDTNLTVTFTQPDNKTVTTASWDAGAHLYRGLVQPAWNYTYVGAWNPTVTAKDAAGNSGTFTYAGTPFAITPATLSTSTQVSDAKTGLPVASIYAGESITITANVEYPTNAEPTSGFVTGLDSVVRGGVVNAVVGWGYWNATAGTFGGSAKNPGGVIGTAKLTNTNGKNGTWTGKFSVASSLPTIPAGASFAVAITSSDSANPPNSGLQVVSFGLAPAPQAPISTTVTSTSTSISSTTSTTTQTISQVTQTIPTVAYAGMVVLLVIGLIMGLLVKMPTK